MWTGNGVGNPLAIYATPLRRIRDHAPDAAPHLTWYNGIRQHQTDAV